MKTSMKLSEKQIETIILNYLSMVPGCKCYKHNNTGVYDPKIQKFRKVQNKYIPLGASDIYGSIKGHAIFIEVKTPEEHTYLAKHYEEIKTGTWDKKTQSKKHHLKNQINFIESNRAMGCLAFFASNLDQVREELIEHVELRGCSPLMRRSKVEIGRS